jgi:hypothetical protein
VGDRQLAGPDRPGVNGRPGRRRRGWLLAACLAAATGLVALGLADGQPTRRAAHKVGRELLHVADRSAPTATVPARVRPVGLTPTADWATYHGDAARSGVARGSPALRRPQPGWTSVALDQPVCGEPLVVGGRVLVATEGDSGHERGRVHVGLAAHFAAPSAAGGLVLLAVGRQVTAVTTR